MPNAPRKPLLVNLAWTVALGLLLAVGYVLSYAPAVRFANTRSTGYDLFDFIDSDELPLYRPVDILIDSTPLRGPLFRWADAWGVRGDSYFACWDRIGHDPE